MVIDSSAKANASHASLYVQMFTPSRCVAVSHAVLSPHISYQDYATAFVALLGSLILLWCFPRGLSIMLKRRRWWLRLDQLQSISLALKLDISSLRENWESMFCASESWVS